MVERYLPHTSDDDDRRYRDAREIEAARERDPLRILRDRLLELGALSEEADEKLHAAARREVNEATDLAESASYPTTQAFYDHVYADAGGQSSP